MYKRLLAAFYMVILATLTPQIASANGNTIGFYVQGDIGLVNLRAKTERKDFNSFNDLKNSYKESSLLPRISIGNDFGDWRVAGDYTHYKSIETSSGEAKSKTRAYGAGLSVIYDIPVWNNWVNPYVGARVSINNIKQNTSSPNNSAKVDDTKLSPGLMAGISYQIAPNTVIDAGYRYNHLDSKLKAHEATLGLRYMFR